MKYNGQTLWHEEFAAWVTYCIPTNFITWKPEEYKDKWKMGIKQYVNILERIGGFV